MHQEHFDTKVFLVDCGSWSVDKVLVWLFLRFLLVLVVSYYEYDTYTHTGMINQSLSVSLTVSVSVSVCLSVCLSLYASLVNCLYLFGHLAVVLYSYSNCVFSISVHVCLISFVITCS